MCSDPVPLLSTPVGSSDWLVAFGCRGGVHPESRVIHTIKYDTRLHCINKPDITLERHRVPGRHIGIAIMSVVGPVHHGLC